METCQPGWGQEEIRPRERTGVRINRGSTEPDITEASYKPEVLLLHLWPGKQILLNVCFLTAGDFSKIRYMPLSSPYSLQWWDKVVLNQGGDFHGSDSVLQAWCCDCVTARCAAWQHNSALCQGLVWGYRVTLSLSSTTKWPHNLGLLMWLKSQSYLFLFSSFIIFLSMGKKEWQRTGRKEIKVEKKEEKMVDKLMPVITAFASVDLCFWWTHPDEIHERERIINNHKSHTLAGGDLLVWKHIFVSNYERHLYLGQDRAVENLPPPDGHGRRQHRVLARQALGCAVKS